MTRLGWLGVVAAVAMASAGCSGLTAVCLGGSLTDIDGDAVQWSEEGLGLWGGAGVGIGLSCDGPDVLVRTRRLSNGAQSHAMDRWPGVDLVELDPTVAWDERGVRRAVAHEFGHALGLGHVGDPDAIMFEAPTADELLAADLDALCEETGVRG